MEASGEYLHGLLSEVKFVLVSNVRWVLIMFDGNDAG